MMQANINRISAERDMRYLTITNSATSSEGAEACRNNLVLEMGQVMRAEDKLDRKGLESLRIM